MQKKFILLVMLLMLIILSLFLTTACAPPSSGEDGGGSGGGGGGGTLNPLDYVGDWPGLTDQQETIAFTIENVDGKAMITFYYLDTVNMGHIEGSGPGGFCEIVNNTFAITSSTPTVSSYAFSGRFYGSTSLDGSFSYAGGSGVVSGIFSADRETGAPPVFNISPNQDPLDYVGYWSNGLIPQQETIAFTIESIDGKAMITYCSIDDSFAGTGWSSKVHFEFENPNGLCEVVYNTFAVAGSGIALSGRFSSPTSMVGIYSISISQPELAAKTVDFTTEKIDMTKGNLYFELGSLPRTASVFSRPYYSIPPSVIMISIELTGQATVFDDFDAIPVVAGDAIFTGLEPGTYNAALAAKDANGNVIYTGEANDLEVVAGQTTHVGPIVWHLAKIRTH